MKPVHGVGINDADYVTNPTVEGKQVTCPFYRKWKSMLGRCYSAKIQEKHPTYVGCSVVEEWLTFSNFRKWMITKNWKRTHLDKDLLIEDNKVYGPETCVFICRALNNLFNDHGNARGDLPLGVSKHGKKYKANVNKGIKRIHLGLFKTPEKAHTAWRKAKAKIILNSRELTNDNRVKKVLTQKAEALSNET